VGTGIKWYRKWKVETPLSPLPLPPEWEDMGLTSSQKTSLGLVK